MPKGIYKNPIERAEKISNSRKGIKFSPEHLENLRLSHLGQKAWNKGKKGVQVFTPERNLKISESHKGEKNYNWIKDRTKIVGRHNRQLHDPDYKKWRKSVCDRDNWKCKISNKDCFGRLEVHHILGWKDYPELRYAKNNGITLCHAHHPRKREQEVIMVDYFQLLVEATPVGGEAQLQA